MSIEDAKRDNNHVTSFLFVGSDGFVHPAQGDELTGRLFVDMAGAVGTVTSIAGGTGILLTPDPITTTGSVALATRLQPMATLTGNSLKVLRVNAGETAVEYATPTTGTVTSVSVVTNQGVSGSVATATTTPAITLSLGALTGVTSFNGLVITANTGVITTGTWNGTVIASTAGGTGVNNAGTITNATNTTITGGGTLALGGFTLTVPATGTAVLLTGTQTITGAKSFTTADVTITDVNVILGTTTGTKFGTATSQKLSFYNSTPIVQPTGDVITALQNLGLIASATIASATNINTATESTDTSCFPVFVTASGTQTLPAKTNTTFTYNSNTNDLGITKINGLTMTASTGTFTLTNAKTLSVTNTLTLSGTDSTTMTFPSTSATLARTDAGNTFTGVSTGSAWVLTSPTITTKLNPTTDDGAPLGDTTHNWSDLFLATGAVINYQASNVVITHTSGILTMGTGTLKITTPTNNATSVVTTDAVQTLSSKFVTPQTQTVVDAGGTLTPVSITNDLVIATALSQATTIAAPSGSPVQGERLVIRLKDNGSARALTWNSIYRASSDLALPTTTILSKTLYCGFFYNSTDSKWDLVAYLNNF